MVAFFRQFLIVLLVLLQNAAPLVHAHTGGDFSETGLHLYEFESLRLIENKMSMSASGHMQSSESCIVNVGSAIYQRQINKVPNHAFFQPTHIPALSYNANLSSIPFLQQNSELYSQQATRQNCSRAPPCLGTYTKHLRLLPKSQHPKQPGI